MNESIIQCPICGNHQLKQILINRLDYEFGVVFSSNYWRCLNNQCRLVFVDPLPTFADISTFYKAYTTHSPNLTLRNISFVAKINRFIYLKKIFSIFDQNDLNRVKVLDYGCGNGNFLQDLSLIGVKNSIGYDMDPLACSFAISQNLVAFSDIKEIELQGPFDYIFLNHVVEHLQNPYDDISGLVSNLREGGKIIIRTPNSDSILCKLFRKSWRGWETPRHLFVFNINSIRKLFEKVDCIKIVSLETSNLMFSGIFNESFHSNFYRKTFFGKIFRKFLFIVIYPLSVLINLLLYNFGEEISLIGVKK